MFVIKNSQLLSVIFYQFYKIGRIKFLLFVCILLSIVNSCFCFSSLKVGRQSDYINTSNEHECPLYSIESKNQKTEQTNSNKILDCNKLDSKNHSSNLPSFLCKCNYAATSNSDYLDSVLDSDNSKTKTTSLNNGENCLLVYVGMAVKGYNLIYRQWVNKENCFNLCLSTTIKNGFNFDCKSFEHWHGDCTSNSSDFLGNININNNNNNNNNNNLNQKFDNETSKHSKVCASFSNDHGVSRRNHRHHNKFNIRTNRASTKLDYCVLSNQTIKTAGSEFATNNAVTYYELLCKRPSYDKPTTTIPTTTSTTKKKEPIETESESKSKNKKTTKNRPKSTSFSSKKDRTEPLQQTESIDDDSSQTSKIDSDKKSKITNNNNKNLTKCRFNPCTNGGACFLIEPNRFTCSCGRFYHGVYCENSSVKKICHKTYMELILHQELANQFSIQITDLYINDKNNPNYCRLKPLNDTHARFQIPYEKCFTSHKNTKFENVYTNRLVSFSDLPNLETSENEEFGRNVLAVFECRFDKQTDQLSNSTKIISHLEKGTNNEKITKSTTPCIIDSLNLKLKIFYDINYRKELLTDSNIKLEKHIVGYDQQLFVQFSVYHSDKLNELYQIQDKLKYFHLTIEKCWLTPTQNENMNILQVLIENGCQKDGVSFDDLSLSKNSIRFSFYFSDQIRNQQFTNVYLHCFPQICTDAPKTSKDHLFYSQFKSCQNISSSCRRKRDLISEHKFDDESEIQDVSLTYDRSLAYSKSNSKLNYCNNKFSIGPINLSEKSSKQQFSQDDLDEKLVKEEDSSSNKLFSQDQVSFSNKNFIGLNFIQLVMLLIFNLFIIKKTCLSF